MSDSSVAPPADLVPADSNDFLSGAELYVRGRLGVCVRFDYPHVYWRWNDSAAREEAEKSGFEPMEKHRSIVCTPEIFQVRAEKKRHTIEENASVCTSDSDSDSDEDSLDHPTTTSSDTTTIQHETDDQTDTTQHTDSDNIVTESNSDVVSGSSSVEDAEVSVARASLMNMFSRRPVKSVFTNVTDAPEEIIQAAMPQSVAIEASTRSSFRVANKVTSITLINCEDVTVEFLSVISSVELIRCRRCTIRCTQLCSTFTLDDSDACTLQFPGFQSRVMFVTTNTHGTNLLAVPGGNTPPNEQSAGEELEEKSFVLENEIRFAIEEPREGAEVESSPPPTPSEPSTVPEEAPSSSSSATKQLRTIWTNGTFTTEILARQGRTGYFTNASS